MRTQTNLDILVHALEDADIEASVLQLSAHKFSVRFPAWVSDEMISEDIDLPDYWEVTDGPNGTTILKAPR